MMRAATVFATFFLSAGIACAASIQSLDPSLGTIFPAEKARELLQQTCLQVPNNVTGTWTPTADEIRELERRLPEALAKVNPNWAHENASRFARQYGGLEIKSQQLIYINAFPVGLTHARVEGMPNSYRRPDWHSHAIIMCDSGGVFGAEYDPQTKEFSNFDFEVPYR
jgi:hypothetical protein